MISIPTIPSLAKACLIYFTAAALLPAAAARPSFDNETTPASTGDNDVRTIPFILVKEPWPAQIGIPPQFNIKMGTWQLLRKRECHDNGSNFCFDNEVNSCVDCGGCCKLGSDQWCCKDAAAVCCSGKKCCAAGSTCCGGGCCAAGSTCNNGKCEVPVDTTTTITITTTIHTTLTHTEMEMVTVQNLVVETSTINSIVTTTVTSNDGTQTEVTYSTATVQANAKRAAEPTPGPVNHRRGLEEDGLPRGLARRSGRNLWRNLAYGGEQDPIDPWRTRISPTEPRQCSATTTSSRLAKRQGGRTTTSTVTETKTETDHTTVHDKKTTTVLSTSVSQITIFQTSTKVVGAKATVSTTSVITITARKATTQVVTSTSTYVIDPTGLPAADGGGSNKGDNPSLNDPSSNSSKKKKGGLSASAVIGIGVGAGLVGLTLLLLGFFFWKRHQKNKEPKAYDFTYSPAPQMTSPTPHSPHRPSVPFGGVGVVPSSHHDTSYTPTVSEMHSDPTPDSYNKTSGMGPAAAAGAGMAAGAASAGRGHTRNSSSISKPLISGRPSPDPYRDQYTESGQGRPTNASELPAGPRYEFHDDDVAAPAPLRTHQQQYQQGHYGQYGNEYQSQQPPPPVAPPPRNQYRTGPHPSTSSISRVTRFAELDGGERMS